MTDATSSMTKSHEEYNASLARQIAAQCWCDPETSGIEMDTRLAEAFAKRLLLWMSLAEQRARNSDFYQNIVIEIGAMFGNAAKTSDDGAIQETVLALKVPELVGQALNELRFLQEGEDREFYYPGGA